MTKVKRGFLVGAKLASSSTRSGISIWQALRWLIEATVNYLRRINAGELKSFDVRGNGLLKKLWV